MDLYDAITAGNVKAAKAAIKAGDRPTKDLSSTLFYEALNHGLPVVKVLIEDGGLSLKSTKDDDNLLLQVGFHIRSAYPNDARNRRAKEPDMVEPKAIVALREIATYLREKGAVLTFGGAAMLGYTEELEQMLAKDPSLAKKKVKDQSPADLAAWAGAWESSRIIRGKRNASGFDWKKLEDAVHAWALKALNAFAKKHAKDTFRRVAFEIEPSEAQILLAADVAGGTSPRAGGYSHTEIANFEEHALSEALVGQLEKFDAAKVKQFGDAVRSAATRLARDKALKLGQSADFGVLVLGHDEAERSPVNAKTKTKAKAKKRKP